MIYTYTEKLTFDKLLQKHGVSMTYISKMYGIPYKTLQNWKALGKEHRECPEYVIRMLDRLLTIDKE